MRRPKGRFLQDFTANLRAILTIPQFGHALLHRKLRRCMHLLYAIGNTGGRVTHLPSCESPPYIRASASGRVQLTLSRLPLFFVYSLQCNASERRRAVQDRLGDVSQGDWSRGLSLGLSDVKACLKSTLSFLSSEIIFSLKTSFLEGILCSPRQSRQGSPAATLSFPELLSL